MRRFQRTPAKRSKASALGEVPDRTPPMRQGVEHCKTMHKIFAIPLRDFTNGVRCTKSHVKEISSMATPTPPLPKNMGELETTLDNIFVKKVPALPENVKEFIVKFGPYITVVLLVLAAPAILAIFGLGTVLAPFSLMGGLGEFSIYTITMILALITFALQILALPGLFKRTRAGWRFMFYGTIVSAISSLLSFNLGSLIIGTAISFYFLFQIRSYYK